MPIRVTCPSCGRTGRVPEEALGRTVQCPACQTRYKLTRALVDPSDYEVAAEPTPRPAPLWRGGASAHGGAGSASKSETSKWPVHPGILGACGLGLVLLVGLIVMLTRPSRSPELADGDPEVAGAEEPAAVEDVVRSKPAPVVATAETSSSAKGSPGPAAELTTPAAPLSTADIVARCEPSVALIKGKLSSGTGFLVGPGLLATNAHVIDEEFIRDIEVRFPSADEARKGPIAAELLYEDGNRDLAFLSIKTTLPPLQVATSYRYRKGEDVIIIGNPGIGSEMVLENAISRGVMSTKTTLGDLNFYQLGISINPGNSGGPVFDTTGKVIGVATLKTAKQEAVAFCIPVEDLRTAISAVNSQAEPSVLGARSRHRLVNVFKVLVAAGAIYAVGMDVHRAVAGRSPQGPEAEANLKNFESFVATIDEKALTGLPPELSGILADASVPESTRQKIDQLWNNCSQMKAAYGRRVPGPTQEEVRSMKGTHRRLIDELKPALRVEVPADLLLALQENNIPDPIATIQGATPRFGPMGPGFAQGPRMVPPPPRVGPTPPSPFSQRGRMPRRGRR